MLFIWQASSFSSACHCFPRCLSKDSTWRRQENIDTSTTPPQKTEESFPGWCRFWKERMQLRLWLTLGQYWRNCISKSYLQEKPLSGGRDGVGRERELLVNISYICGVLHVWVKRNTCPWNKTEPVGPWGQTDRKSEGQYTLVVATAASFSPSAAGNVHFPQLAQQTRHWDTRPKEFGGSVSGNPASVEMSSSKALDSCHPRDPRHLHSFLSSPALNFLCLQGSLRTSAQNVWWRPCGWNLGWWGEESTGPRATFFTNRRHTTITTATGKT